MELTESNFTILAKNKKFALQAIKNLAGQGTVNDSSGKHFSWVTTEEFFRAKTLEKALRAWRYSTEEVNEEDLGISEFTGEKLGDDFLLFQALAPFVVKNSYLQYQGEDGTIWRYVFDGETCEEKTARFVWE
jgi:hypothetical protein